MLEGPVKHRPHQQRQRAALEFVVQHEMHVASIRARFLKMPFVLQIFEWPVQIADEDIVFARFRTTWQIKVSRTALYPAVISAVRISRSLLVRVERIFKDWHSGTNSGIFSHRRQGRTYCSPNGSPDGFFRHAASFELGQSYLRFACCPQSGEILICMVG